jgi:L-ascorbate metabolism protein UlaG (beta-lactamase superfamily)
MFSLIGPHRVNSRVTFHVRIRLHLLRSMKNGSIQPSFRSPRVRRWVSRLWRDGLREHWRPITPPTIKPTPAQWRDDAVTAAWLGHATVLINFYGFTILTDPVLFPRIGIRLPGLFTLGPRRLVAPALTFEELPKIDLILLSHAHFDHFDLRTLRRFDGSTRAITAPRTRDLLQGTRLRNVTELSWGETNFIRTTAGEIEVTALPVRHWGARVRRDDYRGCNGYVVRLQGRTILFTGDTALTDSFAENRNGGVDIAIMAIGCYNPWIRSHCDPEQAIKMANDAGAQFIMPVHHQTFRLSFERLREPIERFEAALGHSPERIALREIGETFRLPSA